MKTQKFQRVIKKSCRSPARSYDDKIFGKLQAEWRELEKVQIGERRNDFEEDGIRPFLMGQHLLLRNHPQFLAQAQFHFIWVTKHSLSNCTTGNGTELRDKARL